MAKLETRYQDQLCTWLESKKSFDLLYKATRDGCSAQTFHQMCDNKGPTVTVCYNTTGYVFGGYTTVSWTSDSTWKQDLTAFLFRLLTPNGFQAKKYPLKPDQVQYSVYCDSSYGPIFGSGNDFHLFRGTINKTGNYFQGNGSTNVGRTYDMQGDSVAAYSGNNQQYTDIETYQVTDYKGPPRCSTPWRKQPDLSQKTLMSHIEKYCPPEGSKVKAINLLLLGPVGAGKSSFFNSVNSIFQREITTLARSGSAERSLTTTYRRYRVRSMETGESLKVRFCDTRGLESDGGLDLVDLMTVIEGHVPDRFQFNPTVPINAQCTGYNSNPSPDDQIHCVAFVIDGTAVDVFPEKIAHILKSLQQRLNPLGIPQIIILTKADKVCPEVQEDVNQMFSSATIADLVDQVGQLFGLPGSCVFPVKNYSNEIVVNEDIDIPILLCLKQVLRYAEDYIQDSLASD